MDSYNECGMTWAMSVYAIRECFPSTSPFSPSSHPRGWYPRDVRITASGKSIPCFCSVVLDCWLGRWRERVSHIQIIRCGKIGPPNIFCAETKLRATNQAHTRTWTWNSRISMRFPPSTSPAQLSVPRLYLQNLLISAAAVCSPLRNTANGRTQIQIRLIHIVQLENTIYLLTTSVVDGNANWVTRCCSCYTCPCRAAQQPWPLSSPHRVAIMRRYHQSQ